MNNAFLLSSSDFTLLVWGLILGIVYLKALWIATEIHYFKYRFNLHMLKTNAIEALILLSQVLVVYVWPLPKTPYDGYITLVGIAMYVTGMFFAIWGRSTMSRVWGIPGEHHTQQDYLVTNGAFAVSRNPIYVGYFFVYTGFCVAIQSWLIILRIPLFLYFYRSAVKEEKLLEKKFGEKYLKYKAHVPRFLFI